MCRLDRDSFNRLMMCSFRATEMNDDSSVGVASSSDTAAASCNLRVISFSRRPNIWIGDYERENKWRVLFTRTRAIIYNGEAHRTWTEWMKWTHRHKLIVFSLFKLSLSIDSHSSWMIIMFDIDWIHRTEPSGGFNWKFESNHKLIPSTKVQATSILWIVKKQINIVSRIPHR